MKSHNSTDQKNLTYQSSGKENILPSKHFLKKIKNKRNEKKANILVQIETFIQRKKEKKKGSIFFLRGKKHIWVFK